MVQMRRLLHQTLPGFADLFEDDHLFHKSIGLPIAMQFTSAAAIRQAGIEGIASHLRQTKVRFQARTIERIVAWAGTAAEPRNSRRCTRGSGNSSMTCAGYSTNRLRQRNEKWRRFW